MFRTAVLAVAVVLGQILLGCVPAMAETAAYMAVVAAVAAHHAMLPTMGVSPAMAAMAGLESR